MLTYLSKGEEYLQTSEYYYEQGLPIEETADIKTAAFYAVLMNKLYGLTGDKNYSTKCYDVSECIYDSRFDEINDTDVKYTFVQYMISEKIQGEIYPKDLVGATRLNEVIKSLGENYYNDYIDNCRSIAKAYSVNKTMQTNSPHTVAKKKGLFGKIFR